MPLVIVESPAKCQKIQGFLGAGWRVIATMGHIRALKHDLSAVGIDQGWKPQYQWISSKPLQALKDAASTMEPDNIYLASDRDREGEYIAYSTALLLKLNPRSAKRISFTEITEKAIRAAVANPGRIDMNEVKAQETRAMLDLLIGFTVSPILWRHVAPALSAGRCQTPALRLVIEKEARIQAFQSVTSWHLTLEMDTIIFTLTDELDAEEDAVNYMENVHTIPTGIVLSNKRKPWSESAPPPLMTSTLQQQASARFGMNPKQTMQHAQKLYEAGHITYMRTDKAVLCEEAVQEARAVVEERYGAAYVGNKRHQEAQGAQGAQEAHEAIRPTHMDKEEVEGDVYQQKLYRLIWQRAIQSVMAPARGETCTVHLQLEGDTEFQWSSTARQTMFEGWRHVGRVEVLEEEEEAPEGAFPTLSALQEGTPITWSSMTAQPKESKAAGRYTEATLVRELESNGIGRPSTFASLLSVIQEKQYVAMQDFPAKELSLTEYTLRPSTWPPLRRMVKKKVGAEKQKLVPTPLGQSVWEFLKSQLDDLFAYGFTANMERRLDQISEGTHEPQHVLQHTWDSYQERYHELMKKPERSKERATVREFGNGLKAVQSKKGPLLLIEGPTTQFFGWPKGVTFEDITELQAQQHVQGHRVGEWNGQPIEHHTGTYGDYLQCGDVKIPFQEESLEETIKRLEAKKVGPIKEFKNYVIRKGAYGPYIMKTSLKKAQFVSLPKGLSQESIAALTEKEVEALYRLGRESKFKPKP